MQIAALTSYSLSVLKDKIRTLVQNNIFNIDLYCFCPNDLDYIKGCCLTYGNEYLIDLDISWLAEQIHEVICPLQAESKNKIDICGLASYFPDISLPKGNEQFDKRRQTAVKSLKSMVLLCSELRKFGYSCKVIELVAGHIVTVYPNSHSSNPKLELLEIQACLDALNESLTCLSNYANEIFQDSGRGPVFSIEVEPGLGKLLGTSERIGQFFEIIVNMSHVGLNLDIGHMLIMGIKEDQIFKSPLGSKVAHIHVSDNAWSHFADLTIGTFHHRDIFARWIRQLLAYTKSNESLFQGFISIEMEACNNIDQIVASRNILESILSEVITV